VTYIEANGDVRCAFDCGPGNALMDDFMRLRTGHAFDRDGARAAAGRVHEDIVEVAYLEREGFFYQSPPKSLDRDDFAYVLDMVSGLSTEDGLATLMAFTVRAMDEAERFGSGALACYVCGGGRHNKALMQALDGALPGGVRAVEALGWNGDATEAEGFAYLAVRSMLGLPLTLPETTGVAEPQTGGVYHSHD
jgi:anhydro-N-acetylmuramic acid kinase